jgi:hypothetical protein
MFKSFITAAAFLQGGQSTGNVRSGGLAVFVWQLLNEESVAEGAICYCSCTKHLAVSVWLCRQNLAPPMQILHVQSPAGTLLHAQLVWNIFGTTHDGGQVSDMSRVRMQRTNGHRGRHESHIPLTDTSLLTSQTCSMSKTVPLDCETQKPCPLADQSL